MTNCVGFMSSCKNAGIGIIEECAKGRVENADCHLMPCHYLTTEVSRIFK